MRESLIMFANPIAGRGKALRIADALRDRLNGHYALENFSLPAVMMDPTRLKATGKPSAVVCIGGDGTLQAVGEVLLKQWNDPPPILLVPLGTANLIAKHLKVPWSEPRDAGRIIEALKHRKLKSIDACRCNGRLFLAVAGVGFDAQVVHNLHRNRSGPITKQSYVLPAVTTLRDYCFPQVRVSVDGKEVFKEGAGLVYVGNVREYGTGVPMLPHARSDDQLLDICILPCKSKRQALHWMMRAAIDEHIGEEGAIYLRGRHVRIDSPTPIPIQLDGEAAGHTPADIELLRHQLAFIVA
jgi:YegS/Rv2252/BmrU family lipid kinase